MPLSSPVVLHSWRASRVLLALALLLPSAARTLPAQRDTAMIPVSLAVALMGQTPLVGPHPRIYVGTLPDRWPTTLVPPAPTTVMGGMSSTVGAVAIFHFDTTRAAATSALEQLLADAGWRRPQRPRTDGFQAAPINDLFCRDSLRLFERPADATASGSVLRVTVTKETEGGGCMPRPEREGTNTADLTLPTLLAPPGVTVSGSPGFGFREMLQATAQVFGTAVGVDSLRSHYVRQLVAAGWTASAPVATDHAAVQLLDAKDSKGKQWSGSLMVTTHANRREVALRMDRNDADR
jgi:hypothetical protein